MNVTLFNRLGIHPEVDRLVGDFTSVVLLEVDGTGAPTLKTLAERLQERLWQDLEHRSVSGVRVLGEWSRALGSPASAPVVFTCAVGGGDGGAAGGIDPWLGELVYGVSQTPQVWLDHQVIELGGALVYSWDALEALFPAGLLDAMFEAYGALLSDLALRAEAWSLEHPCPLPPRKDRRGKAVNATSGVIPEGTLHAALLARRPEAGSDAPRDRGLCRSALSAMARSPARWRASRGSSSGAG